MYLGETIWNNVKFVVGWHISCMNVFYVTKRYALHAFE